MEDLKLRSASVAADSSHVSIPRCTFQALIAGALLGSTVLNGDSTTGIDAVSPPPRVSWPASSERDFGSFQREIERREATIASLLFARKAYCVPNQRALAIDPQLRDLGVVQEEWLATEEFERELETLSSADAAVARAQLRTIVARNLHIRSCAVNEELVQYEARRILQTRALWRHVRLFEGRNVLFAAHSEFRSVFSGGDEVSDVYRFGKIAAQERIKREMGSASGLRFCFRRPPHDWEGALDMKHEILRLFAEMPPPFTFVHDLHGKPESFFISGDTSLQRHNPNNVPVVTISVDELRDAYKKRLKNFPQIAKGVDHRDILILNACDSGTFLRNFCQDEPLCMPIGIASGEIDQTCYTMTKSAYGNSVFHYVLGFADKSAVPTMGRVFDAEFRNDTKIMVMIPDIDGKPMQLAKAH